MNAAPALEHAHAGVHAIRPQTGGAKAAFAVLELLGQVDDPDEHVAGTLHVRPRGGPAGVIFVERRRVCWAAAEGLARRLSDLLLERAHQPLERGRIEALFRECRLLKRPLGEVLVERNLVTGDDLRAALLVHTCESLSALASEDTRVVWAPRAGAGYNPRYTFGTGELAARVASAELSAHAARAEAALTSVVGDGAQAVAFLRDREVATPLPLLAMGEGRSARDLVAVGRGIASMRDLADAISGGARILSASAGNEATLLAWGEAPLLFGAFVDGPRATARLLSRLNSRAAPAR